MIKMKRNHSCLMCAGSGDDPLDAESHSTKEYHDRPLPCPDCDGVGEGILISPKQWKEYQWLEKIADELEAKHIEVSDLRKDD